MSRPAKKQYIFTRLEQLHQIPFDKIEACITDLKWWIVQHKIAEQQQLVVKPRSDTFIWVDDGRHKIDIIVREVAQVVVDNNDDEPTKNELL